MHCENLEKYYIVRNKKILFVSAIDLWGNDNVPLRAPGKTLLYYINKKYDVYIIGIAKNNLRYKKFENVKFVGHIPFVGLKSNAYLRYLLTNFVAIPMLWIYGLIVTRLFNILTIYGYEVHGVIAGRAIVYLSRAKLISRFQGSVLYNSLKHGTKFKNLSLFTHYLAFKMKCHKAVITDDGTKANVVFRVLNKSEYIFLKNGVNIPEKLLSKPELSQILNLEMPERYLCISSRLVTWKRVERSIKALSIMQSAETKPALVIVGGGPRKHFLEELAKELEVQVIFTGHVSQEISYNVIYNCTAFLSFYDLSNLGNPLLEALSCHKPIVTIGNGDTRKVIKDGENGLILNYWSTEVAAHKISKIWKNEELRMKLINGAKDYSSTNLNSWPDRLLKEEKFILG